MGLELDVDPLGALADFVTGNIFLGPTKVVETVTKETKPKESDANAEIDDAPKAGRKPGNGDGSGQAGTNNPVTINFGSLFSDFKPKRSKSVAAPKKKGEAAGVEESDDSEGDESDA